MIDVFNLALGADFDTTEYFNGPVTEVRYDAEWINDTEAYIISRVYAYTDYTSYAGDAGNVITITDECRAPSTALILIMKMTEEA